MPFKLSIIISVYNCDEHLYRCLKSIYSQIDTSEVEVIAVNDFSTDKSLQVLQDFKLIEPSLNVISHTENKSLSVARTTGMNISNGEYIMHVDQDDWLNAGAIRTFISKIDQTHADVLVFNYFTANSNGDLKLIEKIRNTITTKDKILVQEYFLGTAWNKIIKKSIVSNLIYGQASINSAEDLLFATEILLKSNSIILFPDAYYVYYKNTKSITHLTNPEKFINSQEIILNQLYLILKEYKATSSFTNCILRYLEKHIQFAISQSVFFGNPKNIELKKLKKSFELFPEMTKKRIEILEISISKKYHSLIPIYNKFGIKSVFYLLYNGIIKNS